MSQKPDPVQILVAVYCAGRLVYVAAEVSYTDGQTRLELPPDVADELAAFAEAVRVRRARVIRV